MILHYDLLILFQLCDLFIWDFFFFWQLNHLNNLTQSSHYFGTVIWPIVGKSVFQQTLIMFVTPFAENTRNAHGHRENFWVSTHFLSLFSLWLFCFPLRCPNGLTGDRCQNYAMASFYSTSISFSCLRLDWSMLNQCYFLLLRFVFPGRQIREFFCAVLGFCCMSFTIPTPSMFNIF